MNSDQLRKARCYIDWMRKRITLSLDGYYPDWENAPRIRASIGAPTSQDGDVTCKPSIGIVGGPLLRPKIVRRVRQELDKANLPPPSSREAKKTPDLKRENPSFAAMLVKYVNERFGGNAPKVYSAAKVNRKTYSAIVGNELRPVSKQTAIQLALALKLTRTEADVFLKAAGFAFSPAILEDVIVCACISANVFEIDDVNALLAEYGSTPFAVQEGTDRCLQQGDI